MADGKFSVGQIGATFILKVEEDTLSGHVGYDVTQAEVSDIEMVFEKPDRSHTRIGPFTATVRGGTTDEIEFKTTDSTFLDIDGEWKYRGEITTTNGDTFDTLFGTAEVVA